MFDERQKQKNRLEDEMVVESFQTLSRVVTGDKVRGSMESDRMQTLFVIETLGKYLGISIPYASNPDLTVAWYQEEYFRPQGVMWREVLLKDKWYEEATGVMLSYFTDGRAVALLPDSGRGYHYKDTVTGKRIRVTKSNAGQFKAEATLYYRTLPVRKIDRKDVWNFIKKSVPLSEILLLVAATFLVMVLSMVTPSMTGVLLSEVTKEKDYSLLAAIFVILVIVTAASFLISSIKQLIQVRISTKVTIPLQAAFMMRVLTAGADDLKTFSAGDLGTKIGSMYNSLKMLLNMFLSMMLTAACSFICFIQMFRFAAGPALIALAVTIILIILYARVIWRQAEVSADRMEFQAEETGLTYSLIDGNQKITLSGAEKRAFSVWARVYHKAVRMLYNPPFLLKIFSILTPVIMLAGNIAMYYAAFSTSVPQASFFAFLSSYSLLTTALISISNNAVSFANELPIFRVLKPVMDFEPEIGGEKEMVQRLKGNIVLKNIIFRYTDDTPAVLDNLNISIHSGEYVAIVGYTGCGKSTIMRLLLGLEKPDHGEVLYDGKNLQSLDVNSLRRHIGTVLQDGEIFEGSIFSNITISGSGLSEEDAWEAAEIAGIADDIRSMPLQMNTPLPNGGRGVSGGQKQRLLIARAIVSKPSIIFFDEATSALDNVTQKAVSEAIGEMKCTRLVIAHRLSTIQNCDRIICIDKGQVVEEGSYEELMSRQGFFAELVNRQQI